jgi:LysR family nitrogen assimilation transcriptional regulator
MPLSLRQLRYLVAIADSGALSRAAETLSIAQSALSHHISEVEANLGIKVFERRSRGVVLTGAGRRLYDHAKIILSSVAKAEADVRAYSDIATGPIAVGLSHTAIAMVALDVMKAVGQTTPGVHLSIVEGLSPTLIDRVLSGAIDLAIVYNPPKDTRLSVTPLLCEELYLVGREDIIGRSKNPVAFAEIPQKSVLGLMPVPTSRAIIQAQILRNQITPSETLEIDSLSAMRVALEAGLGSAILARSTVLQDLEACRFHARRIIDPVLTRTLGIVALSDRPKTSAFSSVTDTIAKVVRRVALEKRWPAQVIAEDSNKSKKQKRTI